MLESLCIYICLQISIYSKYFSKIFKIYHFSDKKHACITNFEIYRSTFKFFTSQSLILRMVLIYSTTLLGHPVRKTLNMSAVFIYWHYIGEKKRDFKILSFSWKKKWNPFLDGQNVHNIMSKNHKRTWKIKNVLSDLFSRFQKCSKFVKFFNYFWFY